jgi:hypothetical protein
MERSLRMIEDAMSAGTDDELALPDAINDGMNRLRAGVGLLIRPEGPVGQLKWQSRRDRLGWSNPGLIAIRFVFPVGAVHLDQEDKHSNKRDGAQEGDGFKHITGRAGR